VPQDEAAVLSRFGVLTRAQPGAARLFVVRTRQAISEAAVHDAASGARLGSWRCRGAGTVAALSGRPRRRAGRVGELHVLLAASPRHERDAYAATMLLVFEADSRVHPMHARKMCAALQHANAADTPILLHSVPDGGHGPRAAGRDTLVAADALAFLARHTGLDPPPGTRPR
jgi:hypothetical protein